GDMTGKAIVPIVFTGRLWETMLQDHHFALETEEEIQAMEKRIINRGYYPVRVSGDQLAEMNADPKLVEAMFTDVILRTVERWMDIAEEKLSGKDIPCFVCPGND